MQTNKISLAIVSLVTVVLLVALAIHFIAKQQPSTQALAEQGYYHFDTPRVLAAIPLLDLNGKQTTLTDSQPSWQLINFGYMFCPDICPINLRFMKDIKIAWDALGTGKKLGITHITFDPARDTPERLQTYLHYYSEHYIGLTGTLDNIQTVAQQLNTVFIHEPPDEYGNYFITHSDSIALVDPSGQFVGMFKGPYNSYDTEIAVSVLKQIIQGNI